MQKNDRAILITGCSSGIGKTVALGLYERGYQVIASARQEKDVTALKALGLTTIQLDLDDSESIQKAFKECLEITNGKLYGLFNNGAYGQMGAIEDLTRDVLRAQLETNVLGWLELTNLVIPVMRKQKSGRIIQNSSVLGFIALPYRGAYTCSKYAIEGLTDTLRLELKDSGIQVSLIEPGPIRSDFRPNAFIAWKKNIDSKNSVHAEAYLGLEDRLTEADDAVPFTLDADVVLDKVIHALESKKPKIRYYVTVITYVFGYLKRILSSRRLDRVLLAASSKRKE